MIFNMNFHCKFLAKGSLQIYYEAKIKGILKAIFIIFRDFGYTYFSGRGNLWPSLADYAGADFQNQRESLKYGTAGDRQRNKKYSKNRKPFGP